jgi:starvation-inducible DNA-binding protein
MVTTTKSRVIESLKHSQADVVCLYLNAKRYHWYTYGPLFRDLHLLFDEIAIAAFEQIDPLGERLRILGGDPVSAPDEIRSAATVTIASGKPTPAAMLSEALDNEHRVIDEMREGARIADEENDPGTNDLYAGAVQVHEKYAWFLEEALRRGDGIVS